MVIERKNKLLGELLVQDRLISRDQLRIALTDQEKSGEQLGHLLVSLGFISESVLRDALGEALGQESIDLTSVVPDASALQLVPKEIARRYNLVPISYDFESQRLTVAMADTYNLIALDVSPDGVVKVATCRPLDPHPMDDLAAMMGCEVDAVLAPRQEITTLIARAYRHKADEVDEALLFEQPLAQAFGHTAEHAALEILVALALLSAEIVEAVADFLLGVVADGARVEQHHIGGLGVARQAEAVLAQHRRDDLRIRDVHLAPVGLQIHLAWAGCLLGGHLRRVEIVEDVEFGDEGHRMARLSGAASTIKSWEAINAEFGVKVRVSPAVWNLRSFALPLQGAF